MNEQYLMVYLIIGFAFVVSSAYVKRHTFSALKYDFVYKLDKSLKSPSLCFWVLIMISAFVVCFTWPIQAFKKFFKRDKTC